MQYDLFSDADFQLETPFTDRSVCLLGTFRCSTKNLQKKLQALGADIKANPVRGLHYAVLAGDIPAEARERLDKLAFHGYQPRLLGENELDDILSGHYSPYFVPKQVVKNLHLTIQHYLAGRLCYDGSLNPLYTKELCLAPDVPSEICQMLGDQGVYANAYLDDTTDAIVISDSSLQHLHDGLTDNALRHIEQQYNQSRSQTFRLRMTSEGELRKWLESRVHSGNLGH